MQAASQVRWSRRARRQRLIALVALGLLWLAAIMLLSLGTYGVSLFAAT